MKNHCKSLLESWYYKDLIPSDTTAHIYWSEFEEVPKQKRGQCQTDISEIIVRKSDWKWDIISVDTTYNLLDH